MPWSSPSPCNHIFHSFFFLFSSSLLPSRRAGRRARLCGLLIYSEIVSLIDPADETENFFDPNTQSDIGYIKDGSKAGENLSGATPGYVSWNSIKSLQAITQYAMDAGIGGKQQRKRKTFTEWRWKKETFTQLSQNDNAYYTSLALHSRDHPVHYYGLSFVGPVVSCLPSTFPV